MKYLVASCLAAAVAMSPLTQASEVNSGAGWVLGENIGYLFADGDRNLEEDLVVEFLGGYRFDENWEIQLGYLVGGYDSDVTPGASSKIDPGYSLDGVYHFLNGKWQPYVSLGLTDITFDANDSIPGESDSSVNVAGAFGVKRFFGPTMYVGAELKQVFDDQEGDTLLTLGLGYLFGQKGSAPAPAAKAAPAPVRSAPAPAAPAEVVDNDSDDDGVLNSSDSCANTAYGATVDAQGCEIEIVTEKASIEISVAFDSNSSVLRSGSKEEIAKAAAFMKSYSNSTLVIEGHTDNTGAASYNKFLSQKRADAVRSVLIEDFGIASGRVSAIGYGEERPIADNSTATGRQNNRRVVGVVEGQKSVRK